MVFIVAMYVPWCRHLESMPEVKPQLYADNLKCSAERPGALFVSARFTAQYVRSVGHDVSPGKCVLLSTSKSVRKAVKLWATAGVAMVGALPLGFQVKLGLVSIFLPVSMLLKLLTSPPRLLVPFGLPLFGQCGPLKCLLPRHLLS